MILRFLFTFAFLLTLARLVTAQEAASLPDTMLARKHLVRGEELINAAQYDSANAALEQARAIYEQAAQRYGDRNSWEAYVRCGNALGNNLRRKGDYENAFVHLDRALQNGLTHLGEEHAQVGISYGLLGVLFWSKGEYERVEEYYTKALLLKRKAFGENHLEVAHGYNNLGIYYWNKGDYGLALSHYAKALALRRKIFGERHAQVGHSFNNLGIVYWSKGDFERAAEYYLKAQAIFEQALAANDPALGNLYNNLAIVFDERGDYDTAIAHYEKSLAVRRNTLGENNPEVAASYANIGDTYYRKGDFGQARNHLQRALAVYQQTLEENHLNLAQCYYSMGLIHAALNEHEQALAHFAKARQIYASAFGENHPEVAASYNMSGITYAKQGNFEQAMACSNRALIIARQAFGENHSSVAEAHLNLGNVYRAQRDFERALQSYQHALHALVPGFADSSAYLNPSAASTPANPLLISICNAKAEALRASFATGARDVAALHAAFATHLLNAELLDKIRLGYQAEGSKLLLAQKAHESYKRALQISLQLYGITKEERFKNWAFIFAEKNKAEVLAEALQETKARQFAGLPDSLLEQEKTLRVELAYYETELQKEKEKRARRDSLLIMDFESRLFNFKTQYQRFVENLEEHYPRYHELKYQNRLADARVLQKALAPESAMVEYFLDDSTIYIFTLTPERFEITTQRKPPGFDELLTAFLRAVKKIEKAEFAQSSHALFELLIKPIQGQIAEAKRLIIIPEGRLCYVPFEALLATSRAPSKTRIDFTQLDYLVRRYEISYHYSAALLQQASSQRAAAQTAPASFAGFAPIFSDSTKNGYVLASAGDSTGAQAHAELRAVLIAGKRYGELKYSEEEVAGIVKLFARKGKTSSGYFHRQATEENFKQHAQRYRYVHLATHGFLNEEHPKLSGLIFSQTEAATQSEDGILYAGETFNLALHADLVVLSSCESGIGRLVQGEGLMALTRGFIYAGTPNLIVSLWKVYDKHTSVLMQELYENILNGSSHSAALRAAKLKMLRNPATALPAKWSAFVLVGR